MKIYTGKWYVAVRFSNDLCVGAGRGWQEFARQNAVTDRPMSRSARKAVR